MYIVPKMAQIRNVFHAAPDKLGTSTVQDAHALRAGRYWDAGRMRFSTVSGGPFYAITQDGARMAGLEMLYSALWNATLGEGMWMPPMGALLVQNGYGLMS